MVVVVVVLGLFLLFCCYCDLLFRSRPSSPPVSVSAWPLKTTSLQAWEMNGREGRPGQARPVEAERSPLWGRGRARPGARRRAGEMETVRNLDTSCCTYMGPAPRASQPRAAARWHGTGKGNHNLEKSLDAGGLAAPQEAHLIVHTWHGGV